MKKIYILIFIFLLSTILWWFFGRTNPDVLWRIISQQCIPNQQQNNNPMPCLKVDLGNAYILFKASNGPYHDLIMPTERISGIESPELQKENAPSYFAQAWDNRTHLNTEMGKRLNDAWISLAVNSKYGRSQNQLHIHIACLRRDVYRVLSDQARKINQQWRPLEIKLVGHQYLARKLSGADLTKEDPFRLLKNYVAEQGDSIENYGLALAVSPQGDMLLLANRLKLADMNLGSAGEIQDYQCSLANY